MKLLFSGCVYTGVFLTAFSGCQTVPPRPLALEEHLKALETRALDAEPVKAYALSLASSPEAAPPFNPEDGISLHEAEAIALWYNPELRLVRLDTERARALAEVAGRWDDPSLDLSRGRERETLYDSEKARDFVERTWISAASLSITLPLSGRLAAARKARSAEHVEALVAVAEAELEMLTSLREAWLRWAAEVERLRLLEAHLTILRDVSQIAQSLSVAGELEPGSARMFAIELAQQEALRAEMTMNDVAQRAALLERLGLLPNAPVTLTPDLDAGSTPVPDAALTPSSVLTHPSVTRLEAAYEAAEARLRVAIRKQFPDITLSPGYSDEGDLTSVMLGAGIPLPVWNANRQGIAEAVADRDVARARAENGVQHLESARAQAVARRDGAQLRRKKLAADAAPLVDEQMAEAQALLEVGEADAVMLFQALLQANSIKQGLLDATLEERLAQVKLVSLTSPFPTDLELEEADL